MKISTNNAISDISTKYENDMTVKPEHTCGIKENIESIYLKNEHQIEHLNKNTSNLKKTVDRTTSLTDNNTLMHLHLGRTNNGYKSDKLTNTSDKSENIIKDIGQDVENAPGLSSFYRNMSTKNSPSSGTIASMSTNNELVNTSQPNNCFKGDILINNTILITL